jgi:hypothetical protein
MAIGMDDLEQIVETFLRHLGHHVIAHPDGNDDPPDLLVDHRIAVEVRRLNVMREVLASFGSPQDGVSWFVHYSFERPLPRKTWKDLKHQLKAEFSHLIARGIADRTTVKISGLTVMITRASKRYPTLFLFGSQVDEDTGSLVIQEVVRAQSRDLHRGQDAEDRTCAGELPGVVAGPRGSHRLRHSQWIVELLRDRLWNLIEPLCRFHRRKRTVDDRATAHRRLQHHQNRRVAATQRALYGVQY